MNLGEIAARDTVLLESMAGLAVLLRTVKNAGWQPALRGFGCLGYLIGFVIFCLWSPCRCFHVFCRVLCYKVLRWDPDEQEIRFPDLRLKRKYRGK